MNQNAFRKLSYGVYIVSTWDNGKPTGCTANSVMQITSEPATIAVSINHDNYTNRCIQTMEQFSISILSEQSEPSIIGTFGFYSGADTDKFENVAYDVKNMMPVIQDACAYLVCKVVNKFETATHTIFLGEVVDADLLKEGDAMTYAYYHKVIKGSSPKNAPTYLPPQ